MISIPVANFRRGQVILGGANVDGGPSWLYLDNHCLVFILVKNNSIVIAATSIGPVSTKLSTYLCREAWQMRDWREEFEILRWVRWGREASKVGGRQGREDEVRERLVREEMIWEEGREERGVADGRWVQAREEEEGQVQWWMREGGNWQEGEEGVGCKSRSMGSRRKGLVSNISLLVNITQAVLVFYLKRH